MDKPYREGKFAQKKQTKSQRKESNRLKQESLDQQQSRRTTRQNLKHGDKHENSLHAASTSIAATIPPWRQPESARSTNYVKSNLQAVGSWSAYSNNGPAPSGSGLNPQASAFTPYQPLRISNGQAERKALQVPQKSLHTAAQAYLQTISNQPDTDLSLPSSHNGYGRYNVLDPDVPIASIEQTNAYTKSAQFMTQSRNLRSSSVKAPAPPSPTAAYLLEAAKDPVYSATPRKLLVILDLNGTLLYRPSNTNRTSISIRPGVPEFLDYLFQNHMVMVYTSTRPYNAAAVVDKVLQPHQRNQLVALWGRDMLDLTPTQYSAKVQVYKKLDKVWSSSEIQATASHGSPWDQTNTVLVDDSHLKALAQPHNLLQIAEYTKTLDPRKSKGAAAKDARTAQENVMKQLELQLEALKCQIDVSRLIRKWQMRRRPVSTSTGQVVSETGPVDPTKEKESLGNSRQLLTPQSLVEDSLESANEDAESINESRRAATSSLTPRSVSPISEDTFKDLLSGLSVQGAPTPPAEES